MLGTAAWLRCLTYDAQRRRCCKHLKCEASDLGRFLLTCAAAVQFHAEITLGRRSGGAGAHQLCHIAVTAKVLFCPAPGAAGQAP
ncbi:hypothetical protein METH_06140 [Leisingera methylohalidivorans DSM 14336]|uniref:Uncharacterized protein n=1 Tax=Leisingera methylohalidivorans DSM 14336 TaxID=999552 RepID=V9VVZ1_9RHOB|nr:hypothetical protein METH_06140 [Leisingera methylohalidivorans DSM 14336]